METEQVFVVQFVLSLVAWGVVARWTFAPQLARMAPATALSCLALPHAFRHVGMVFVVPGVVAHQLPEGFAVPAAYGDLATGVLALVAVVLLRAKWTGAIGLVWLFNVVGALDLANALRHVDVVSGFGSAWYIPTMLVPLLLVTHFMMFVRLVKGAGEGGGGMESRMKLASGAAPHRPPSAAIRTHGARRCRGRGRSYSLASGSPSVISRTLR